MNIFTYLEFHFHFKVDLLMYWPFHWPFFKVIVFVFLYCSSLIVKVLLQKNIEIADELEDIVFGVDVHTLRHRVSVPEFAPRCLGYLCPVTIGNRKLLP